MSAQPAESRRLGFRLELPPLPLFLLILSCFLTFGLLELHLFLAYREYGLHIAAWEFAFWGSLVFWSVKVEVRLALSASMSQLFIFALALVVIAPPWFAPLIVFIAQWGGGVWYKELFNRSQDGLATALAALAWQFFQ